MGRALALALIGCASSTLRYAPERPVSVAISADYAIEGDRLRVAIASEGYRVEDAWIMAADGSLVTPEALVPASGPGGGGVGVGGGASAGSGGVHAAGVGLSVDLGALLGGRRSSRYTQAVFPLDGVGSAPWRLWVKVVGLDAVTIVLDPVAKR